MNIKISNETNVKINQNMIGLFFEDINYAADGGLYAEMLENRSFSFVKSMGDVGDYYTVPAFDYAWDFNNAKHLFVSGSPLSEENANYLRLTVTEGGTKISNKAYEGISLKNGEKYNFLMWARPVDFEGDFKISIGNSFAKISAKDYIDEKYNYWKLYSCKLTASESVKNENFNLSFEGKGIIEISYVSLIPESAVFGIFRADLYNLLKDLHPGFIRFPGGCIVEGNTLYNRYRYKETLKPTWERKTNFNRWAVHGNSKNNNKLESEYAWYNQTLGLGFYEYFLLCESIGAKALPVLNVGFACQYQSNEMVDRDSEEFKEFLQDAIDLIEFANGDENTKWGKIRIKMGHPKPFNLEMLGIGNEQWQTEKADFFERYVLFERAIHEYAPYIKLIGSAGPDITSKRYTMAWDFYRKNKNIKDFAYALDEHYYVAPSYLFEHNDFYDNYDREIKVFAGEYAAHPICDFNRPDANTLWGALAEAAFLTGVERNGDVVVLASYAPLFARVNYAQWSPDMIWFNTDISYGSPSYHVQKMYASNMGDETIKVFDLNSSIKEGIYYNVSRDSKTGERIIKLVNSNDRDIEITFDIEGNYNKNIKIISLTGPEKNAYNSIEKPLCVNTSEAVLDSNKIKISKYSFNVLRF